MAPIQPDASGAQQLAKVWLVVQIKCWAQQTPMNPGVCLPVQPTWMASAPFMETKSNKFYDDRSLVSNAGCVATPCCQGPAAYEHTGTPGGTFSASGMH